MMNENNCINESLRLIIKQSLNIAKTILDYKFGVYCTIDDDKEIIYIGTDLEFVYYTNGKEVKKIDIIDIKSIECKNIYDKIDSLILEDDKGNILEVMNRSATKRIKNGDLMKYYKVKRIER